jgi:hypothetical protein
MHCVLTAASPALTLSGYTESISLRISASNGSSIHALDRTHTYQSPPIAKSLLQPLDRPRIIRQTAPFRAWEGRSPDIVVVLANSSMRVFHARLHALEAVGRDLVACSEERMLERRLRREAFLGVVFEKARE